MMETTIEQKREAVLAECERICPEIHNRKREGMISFHKFDQGCWELTGPNGYPLTVQEDFKDPFIWDLAWRLLGLETRAAVAMHQSVILKLTKERGDCINKLDAEREKTTTLVEALEEIHDTSVYSNEEAVGAYTTMRLVAKRALAAHGKGDSNG